MLSGFCPGRFGVLFCRVVLGCRYTPYTSGPCCQWCQFLNWDRRSVAVLCMLYKIRCIPMHPLYGALPEPYVLVCVTRSAVVAHRHTYAPPRCRTSQYRRIFILLSVSMWNNRGDLVVDGVALTDFKSRANAFLLV